MNPTAAAHAIEGGVKAPKSIGPKAVRHLFGLETFSQGGDFASSKSFGHSLKHESHMPVKSIKSKRGEVENGTNESDGSAKSSESSEKESGGDGSDEDGDDPGLEEGGLEEKMQGARRLPRLDLQTSRLRTRLRPRVVGRFVLLVEEPEQYW
ncbi:hypothetical protein BDV93DRAFT_513044 [Ceratobasidium sp. AG-I]|nr:hypothetical protein BDV93DRAFT_513044 [Ceratobasidium sp. AG-I]